MKNFKRLFIIVILMLFAISLFGCNKDNGNGSGGDNPGGGNEGGGTTKVEPKISFETSSYTLEIGEEVTLNPIVTDIETYEIEYSEGKSDIVTKTGVGKYKAVAAGKVQITAKVKGYSVSASVEITVKEDLTGTITFHSEGGSEVKALSGKEGETVDYSKAITTWEDHEFIKWATKGGDNAPETFSKGNIDLYAVWYGEIFNDTIFLGHYPQNRVTDEALITKIKVRTNIQGSFGGYAGNDIYVYEGRKYIFVKPFVGRGDTIKGDVTFPDGTKKISGREYCIELEPIEWKVKKIADKKYKITSKKVLDYSEMGLYNNLSDVDSKYFEKFENTTLYHNFGGENGYFSYSSVFTKEERKLLASDFSLPKKSDYYSGLVTGLDGIIKEATDYACLRGAYQNKWAKELGAAQGEYLPYAVYDYWFSDCPSGQSERNLEYYYRSGTPKAANCYEDAYDADYELGVVPQYIIDLRDTNTFHITYFDSDKETLANVGGDVFAKEGDKAYFTVPSTSDLSLKIPTDYMFVGFKNFDESDTTLYKVDTKYEITSENLKLYAVYEEDTREVSSNITYELNGGATNGSNPATILSTATITLADATHESRYKKFAGWYSEATGGEKVTTLTKIRHNLTLYARWEDLDPNEVDFTYTELTDGTYAISAVSGVEYTSLVIPAKYKGKDVTEVKANGFKDITTITSITFPESLKTIRSGAFYGLSALEELTIPKTIETVEQDAFASCGLKKLNLAKASYTDPFKGNKLEEIVFADDFDTISRNMFTGIEIKNLVFPETIKEIGDSAFLSSKIENLTLPKNLETLYCYAFQLSTIGTLTYLSKNVSFSAGSLTNVDASSVFLSAKITKVIIGSEVESFMTGFVCPTCDELDISLSLNAFLKMNSSVAFLSDAKSVTFNGVALSGDITIEDGVKVLPSKLFKDTAITSLYIPDGIEYYGTNLLSGCSSLKELNVPATSIKTSPTSTNEEALIYLFGINQYEGSTLYSKANNTGYYPNTLEKITARSAGKKTYNESFDFNSLKEVYLPEGGFTTSTGSNYLIKDANLEKLYIGKIVNNGLLTSGVFANLKNLKELTIPSLDKSCKEIFGYTPSNYVIEKITILGGTSLVANAFEDYTTLKEINLPNTITSIGAYAFAGLPITEFTIGSKVTTIGNRAFASTKLTSLTIPKSVTSIGSAILYNAKDMTSLKVEAGNSKYSVVGTNTIVELNSGEARVVCTIPSSTWPTTVTYVGAYAYWFLDTNTFDVPVPEADDKTITYEAYAFSGAKVKTLNVGSKAKLAKNALSGIGSIEAIELSSFDSSIADLFGSKANIPSSLATISFGDGITTIPDKAFQGMADMKSVDGIDFSKITSIGEYAFDGCKSFESDLNLPACTSVGKYAFKGMKNIAIYLPNCTTVGDYAFDSTNGLTYVDISGATNKTYCPFSNVTTIGVIHLGKDFKGRLFTYTSTVEGIIIDDGLTELPANAIHSGDTKGKIGWLVLPGSVQSHGTQAVCHTYNGNTWGSSITTIYYKGTSSQKTSFMNYSKLVNDNTANNDTSYTAFQAATWYMYSESSSSGCWHYNAETGLPELYS